MKMWTARGQLPSHDALEQGLSMLRGMANRG
jgi:hypothetical protein